jgi:3-hydroxyisobutyrate dehydrogenase
VGEAFSLDEPTSPKQSRLRRLNRGWKAAPTGSQKKHYKPEFGVALRRALVAADWKVASLGEGTRALILGFLQSRRMTQKRKGGHKEMKVAFIGMGTMGAAMALNILKAGHAVTVHNRSREREEPMAKAGARRAGSPKEAATGAEIVIICVSDTPDVEAVVLGENGIIQGATAGTVVVDMSTISPSATRRIAAELSKKGIRMLDAPVSGGSEGAQKGTLTIMVGGQAADVAIAMPVLSAMGKSITHVGPSGAGQFTKAINQVIISGVYLAVAEGMTLGLKAGLDMEKVVLALAGGAAGSWVLNFRSGNMIKNEYPLGFRVRLHRKDVAIAMEAARELGVFLPATALVEQIENGLISQGFGDEDMSAMARMIRKPSGLE